MVAQPSKTLLVGCKSRDVSERVKYLQRRGEHLRESLSRLPSFLPISSHHSFLP